MATKAFFINSTLANYGEEEFNFIQKFLIEQGILNTEGSDWEDWVDNGDLKVTQRGAGVNMSVDVDVGWACVDHTRSSVTCKVFCQNNAIANLVITNNSSGSNRVDAIILRVDRDAEPNSLMNNIVTIEVALGSGVSALSDGDIQTLLGDNDDFIRLADITVPNGTSDIENNDIADTRVRAVTNDAVTYSPEILRLKGLTADPATANLVEGDMWYNTTDNRFRYYDGSSIIDVDETNLPTSAQKDALDGTGTPSSSNKYVTENEVDTKEIVTAGETINGDTLPVAIFMDDTDNEVLACDANNQAKLRYDGFAITNGTNGNPITIQGSGIVDGFTGLDLGKDYYVQDDKTIGTTIGTYELKVGVAISATQLLIQRGNFEFMGSLADTADSIAVPDGARIVLVTVSYDNSSQFSRCQITLSKKGLLSVTFKDWVGSGQSITVTSTWNVGAATITLSGATNQSGTAYFYR